MNHLIELLHQTAQMIFNHKIFTTAQQQMGTRVCQYPGSHFHYINIPVNIGEVVT